MEHLYDKLIKYSVSDYYGFHMPGHKRQQITGAEKLPYEIDITEIEGFDDLHHAEDLFINLQEYAAEVFHAEETHYLVNGSTVGLLSAVLGCTGYGDRILMARNCHKSVYNAVDLNGLIPEYVYPEFDETTDLNGEIRAEKIEQILEKDRGMNREAGIKAVVITSPTYDGVVSDIERISEVVHKYGIPLIVDEAHGAHFGFHEYFPQNANVRGADIVIHSLHKTLPSLTQTALLHMNGKLVDRDSVRRYLHMLQSSSPSYILMASIDECIRLVDEEREKVFKPYVEMLCQLRKEIGKLKNLQLLETMQYDASKIVISARGRMSGKELQEILLENDHLQMEMAAGSYVIAMTGPGDTQEGMNRLLNALRNLDKRLDEVLQGNRKQDKNLDEVLSGNRKMDAAAMKKDPGFCRHPLIPAERVVESAKVKGRKGLAVPWQEAVGKVSLEFVYLYPPGIPIVVPGERVSEEAVQQILDYEKNGFTIEGTKKKDRLEVLKNG